MHLRMRLKSFRSLLIKQTNAQGNLPFKSLKIISIISLVFLLLISIPAKSDIYALPKGGGGHSLGAVGGGVGGVGGVGGSSGGPISGNQPNSIGGGPLSGLNPNTNCMGTGILVPSVTNCASPNVIHPANAPNTAVVQPSNCNAPTSVHTNTPKNIVVHPSTINCASPNVIHPANAPNAAVVQPSNCNVPTSVHHTNTPSTVVVHPTNCPPPSSGSSNSLTVNNVQSSGSSGSTTSTQSATIPVANAGPNQKVHPSDQVTLDGSKSYDPNGHSLTFSWLQLAGGPVVTLSNDNKAKPTFSAPLVTNTTNLTFQLLVNNGNTESSPSFVSVTITP
jgi:K319L-like, PKD domain